LSIAYRSTLKLCDVSTLGVFAGSGLAIRIAITIAIEAVDAMPMSAKP
jgi:hypothetical protein